MTAAPRSRRAVRTVALMTWLVTVWVLLWGELTPANVVGGLLAGGAVVLLAGRSPEPPTWQLRPVGLAVFAAVFARELVKANVAVLRQVLLWPNGRFREAVVAYPAAPLPAPLLTVLSQLITLTPGTMTVEVRADEHLLYVHLLHLDDAHDIAGALDGIRVLERIVVRALATDADAAAARAHWATTDVATDPATDAASAGAPPAGHEEVR